MKRTFFGAALILATQLLAAQGTSSIQVQFHDLLEEYWQWVLRESPEWASQLGDQRYVDRWTDKSMQAIEARQAARLEFLERLDTIPRDRLSADDQLNHRIFQLKLQTDVEDHRFLDYLIPLNQRGGIQTIDQLARQLSFQSTADYQAWIRRLRRVPELVDQTLLLLQRAVDEKMLHPKIVVQRIPAQIGTQIVENPDESPFYLPFVDFSGTVAEGEQTELRRQAKAAIKEGVVPAYRKLLAFFNKTYIPASFDRVGSFQQKNGRERYRFLVGRFTTTPMTPEEVHELGLREVARIRQEMQEVIKRTGFAGSFQEFLQHLRTSPEFYFEDPQDLLRAYRDVSKQIDPQLVKVFKRLPRTPYGVEPIPDVIAPDTTTAYYQQPAADGSRAGTYYVNLYKPEVRPKYEIEALSIHEAVPGHHLQIALAQELGELPAFRRYQGYTAFTEGWALYSESLGEEMGFYKDPYSKFGQLTYEMWRAVRLVVDTGMHYLQWDRQKAIDFFKENAAKTEHDIINEIDRYIAWPGQALAYKIGELKIKELRARATRELGERFDIKDFHDVVLSSGAIPLTILEENVDRWIARVAQQTMPE